MNLPKNYQEWIDKNVPEDPTGKCAEVTEAMQEVFPELNRVRGHYICPLCVFSSTPIFPHWWLVAPDGQVIDPTAAQFPSKGSGVYEPHDESEPEPTGKCHECGNYCYDGNFFCCENCEISYMAYMNSGRL